MREALIKHILELSEEQCATLLALFRRMKEKEKTNERE